MWVLIIVMLNDYLGDVHTQEFTSQDRCEQARSELLQLRRGLLTKSNKSLEAVCVEK